MKHSFKMPKHGKIHVDFVEKLCIFCFREGNNLRPINNAEATYLNLKKLKKLLKPYQDYILERLFSG